MFIILYPTIHIFALTNSFLELIIQIIQLKFIIVSKFTYIKKSTFLYPRKPLQLLYFPHEFVIGDLSNAKKLLTYIYNYQ